MSDTGPNTARRIVMTGRVQGVGYRPFVYRLAHEHALAGHVRNLRGDVEVIVAGAPVTLDAFERELVTRAPPLAQPRVRAVTPCAAPDSPGFSIAPSSAADSALPVASITP